jgi:hypothetical protein
MEMSRHNIALVRTLKSTDALIAIKILLYESTHLPAQDMFYQFINNHLVLGLFPFLKT